jgi:GxxExxY protein
MTFRLLVAVCFWVLAAGSSLAEDKRSNNEVTYRNRIILCAAYGSATDPGLPGQKAIVSIGADGADVKTVLEIGEQAGTHAVRVSPTGDCLAFGFTKNVADPKAMYALWILKPNGEKKMLAEEGIPAAWSPDGKQVAFYRYEKGSFHHFVADVATKSVKELKLPKSDVVQDWAPDGSGLLVVGGNPEQVFKQPRLGDYPLRELYLQNVTCGSRKNLRVDPLHDDDFGSFSPDGKHIAFQRRRHAEGKVLHFLVVQERDGMNTREVVHFDKLAGDYNTFKPNGRTCWSPDGKSLVVNIVKTRDEHGAARRYEGIIASVQFRAPLRFSRRRRNAPHSTPRCRHRPRVRCGLEMMFPSLSAPYLQPRQPRDADGSWLGGVSSSWFSLRRPPLRALRLCVRFNRNHPTTGFAMTHNEITGIIIDTALHIHRKLGPGLLESVYAVVLAHELRKRGLHVEREVCIPVHWDNITMEVGFRADLIVEGLIVVELKSALAVHPVWKKTLLTYLRLADKRLGLLINFGEEFLKDGLVRVANGLKDEHHAEPQSPQRSDMTTEA